MERIQLGILKTLLGLQVHIKTLYVLAEFERYPLHVTWQSQAAKYLHKPSSLTQSFPRRYLASPNWSLNFIPFLWQPRNRSTLSCSRTPCTHHVQHMWHSCNLSPPARRRCTGTSKWDTAASRTSKIAATSISGVLLLNFGQDPLGLTSRLAGFNALRDSRTPEVRCTTIEY